MRNPSRTLQNSIFEPLYSPQEELHFQPTMLTQSSPSDWLSQSLISPPLSIPPPPPSKATLKRAAAASISHKNISSIDSSSDTAPEFVREAKPTTCDQAILGMRSPSGSSSIMLTTSTPIIFPPSRSRSASDVIDRDDGSVASKLLSSITKSISSPSLLACCKESARETPYQKTLRLRTMKLQHCAEELGSESCDGSLCDGDFNNNTLDSLNRMSSSQSTRDFTAAHQKREGNASSMMISVRSSPNLVCSPLVSKHTSQIKARSFPPPLSHSLPRSPSSDSFSYSLRAYREDGRFVLKEVKVPCRQYFQASRKDGRLTLQRLTTDEDFESKDTNIEAHKECNNLQVDDNVGVYGATGGVASDKAKGGGSCGKIEVESANTANLARGLEACGGKGNKKSNHVGVENIDEKNNMEEVACLFAESLLMATSSNGKFCCSAKNDSVNFISHGGASSKKKSDFKAGKRQTSKAVWMRSSNRHLLSSAWNQQAALLHLPGKSLKLKPGHDFDATKLSHCAGNLDLESKSRRGISIGGGRTLQGLEFTSTSLRKSGYSIGKSPTSTVIFKDVSAKSLMENVSKLVASFGLECGGKWTYIGEEIKSRERDKKSYNHSGGIMESSMYKGIKSINIGVREIGSGSHESVSGVSVDVKSCEHDFHCSAFREGECVVDATKSRLPSSSHHFDVQIPSSMGNSRAALQGKEWLHTLHCKELFDRNLAKGAFMKLHCVA